METGREGQAGGGLSLVPRLPWSSQPKQPLRAHITSSEKPFPNSFLLCLSSASLSHSLMEMLAYYVGYTLTSISLRRCKI
jgi:hypothetical protein